MGTLFMVALTALISAAVGAGGTTFVQRVHVGWTKRRDCAQEAYEAVVEVFAAMAMAAKASQLAVAKLDGKSQATHAEEFDVADTYLDGPFKVLGTSLDRLREADLKIRALWDDEVAKLFQDFYSLAVAWLVAYVQQRRELIYGIPTPDFEDWSEGGPRFNWSNVFAGKSPDADDFERDVLKARGRIRDFARVCGIVITDQLSLPGSVQNLLREAEQERALVVRKKKP